MLVHTHETSNIVVHIFTPCVITHTMYNGSWPGHMQYWQQFQAPSNYLQWPHPGFHHQTTSRVKPFLESQEKQLQNLLQHQTLQQQHERQQSSQFPDISRYYAHNSLQQTHLTAFDVGPPSKRIKSAHAHHQHRKSMAKYWLMASLIEFCPEGSLEFSWSAYPHTNAGPNVQETATDLAECTIGLVWYELTGENIAPMYLLKALSQLKCATDPNSWHHQMLDCFVKVAKKQKVAKKPCASESYSDISIGRVRQCQFTDVRGFRIVDCDQLQQMHMNIECVTTFDSGAACHAPITLEQRIGCFKKAMEGNLTAKRNPDDSLVEGFSYDDLLAQWQTYCRRLRDAALKSSNCHWQLPATKALEAPRVIHVQSGPHSDDQVQQLRQELEKSKELVQKLEQRLLSEQQPAVQVQPTIQWLPGPTQQAKIGRMGGVDGGGVGGTANASKQKDQPPETLGNVKTSVRTRSKFRADAPPSWVAGGILAKQ